MNQTRLSEAIMALERQMIEQMDQALGLPDREVRRKAVRLLVAWRTPAAMELVYGKACKYDVPPEDVDCAKGIQKGCMVFCCRKLFVRMTAEDLAEGLEMHPGMPWFLRLTAGGCYALDPKTGRCTIWDKRPIACRLFNCYSGKPGRRQWARD